MTAKKRHGIEVLTQFAMEVIRRSGEEALLYYGKGNSRIKFDECSKIRPSDYFPIIANRYKRHRTTSGRHCENTD